MLRCRAMRTGGSTIHRKCPICCLLVTLCVVLPLGVPVALASANVPKLDRECKAHNAKACDKLVKIAKDPKESLSDRVAAIAGLSDRQTLSDFANADGNESIRAAAKDRLDQILKEIQARAEGRSQALQKLIVYELSIEIGDPPGVFNVFRDCGHEANITRTDTKAEYSLGLGAVRETPLQIVSIGLTGLDGILTVGHAGVPLATLKVNRGFLTNVGFMTTLTADEQKKIEESKQRGPQNALGALRKRQSNGTLPGLRAGEDGQAQIKFDVNSTFTFPVSFTILVTKPAEPGVSYSYTFVKADEATEWDIQAASKTGATGKKTDLLAK